MARLGSVHLAGLGAVATVSVIVLAVVLRPPPPGEVEALGAPVEAPTGTPRESPLLGAPVRATAATARAPAPVAVPISAGGSADARETFARMGKEIKSGRFNDALSSLEALLEQDPNAARDREVKEALLDLSQRIMLVDGDAPDRMFDIVTKKMGTPGIDLLYELMTTRGGSRAAARAAAVLSAESVRERGTPALRIAYDLYTTKKCEDKRELFARAGAEGDVRALGQLALLNRSCSRRQPCCFHNDPDLKAAMEAIKNR